MQNSQKTAMGFWSNLFPGIEGSLADILWSNQGETSGGIILADENYFGTNDDDTIIFGQSFFITTPTIQLSTSRGAMTQSNFKGPPLKSR